MRNIPVGGITRHTISSPRTVQSSGATPQSILSFAYALCRTARAEADQACPDRRSLDYPDIISSSFRRQDVEEPAVEDEIELPIESGLDTSFPAMAVDE